MKIGIVTQPLMGNYGGLLQNFALQKVLRDMGHVPITLDQKSWHLEGLSKHEMTMYAWFRKFLGKRDRYTYNQFENTREYTLRFSREFVDKYINSTPKFSKDSEFRKYCVSEGLDAVIVGSDQVWRPMYAPHIEQSFLGFTQGLNIKRVAYAASFGIDTWEYNDELTKICADLAQSFDAISVRESSGIKLCRDNLRIDAKLVLDPTLLINADEYIKIVNNAETLSSDGGMFAYILDMTTKKKEVINSLSSELHLVPFYVNQAKELTFNIPKDLEEYTYPPVEQWLRSFIDADFVICDSFHGMVFSIIFNKDFIVIANKKRGLSRFTSMLELFELEDRLFDTNQNVIKDFVNSKPINWEKVNDKKEKMKIFSIGFLKDAIS